MVICHYAKNPTNIMIELKKEIDIITQYVMYNFQFCDKSFNNFYYRQFRLALFSYQYK